jgi:predicted kinase
MNLRDILNERQLQPVVYIMLGAPGSGKSTWIRANKPGFAKWIDTDEINFREFAANPETHMKTLSRAGHVARDRYYALLKRGESVVLDGSNASSNNLTKAFGAANEAGYKTFLVFIDVPYELALKQVYKRSETGGRIVPSKAIKSTWETVNKTYNQVKSLPWSKVIRVRRSYLT